MARPGIKYQEVAAAADSIIAEGDNPTIEKIRFKLGTGSPNTIHRHLTVWRAASPIKQRRTPELPVELQVALVQEFERQAAEVRTDLEDKLTQAQSEASELAEVGERIEAQIDELTECNQVLSDECQRLRALADERANEVKKLEANLSKEREAAEKVRIQTAVCEAKLESSAREIARLGKDLVDQKADFERRLAEQMTDIRRREKAFETQIIEMLKGTKAQAEPPRRKKEA